ncbi:hypothetical protein A3F59_02665 [Candidatus Roizmanbacteria bacterium RIFCSPHIGHO2_12_FULL_38_13]|nr:MAG: hypothetical protein A3F59_02665 [Candidatus Roizmanbacteria bacterium RIFCSPHIGHO2_12_FULL_38_13]
MKKKEKMLCAKCGVELERGTTYLRQKDGTTIHAKGDYCPAKEERGEDKISWSEIRKNLEANVKKYPALLLDVIDSAYLAGLEASNGKPPTIYEIQEARQEERERILRAVRAIPYKEECSLLKERIINKIKEKK